MPNKLEPKYNQGDKFTIEIAEVNTHYDDDKQPYNVYRVKGFKSLFVDEYALDKLEKNISGKTVEDMRKELKEFCSGVTSCDDNECPLHTSKFSCGRGKHFLTLDINGNYQMSDEEIMASYYKAFIENKQEKKPLNTKFIVTSAKTYYRLTVGKIYEIKNGHFTDDAGFVLPGRVALYSIEDLKDYFSPSGFRACHYGCGAVEFIEVVE